MHKTIGTKSVLDDEQRAFLDELGLSKGEVELLDLLVAQNRAMTAQDVASCIMIYPNAVYRMFYRLESLGLVYRQAKRPRSYRAVSVGTGFEKALQTKTKLLHDKIERVLGQESAPGLPAQIFLGREALYQQYVVEANRTTKSIDIFSIGIAFSDELYQVQSRLCEQGVRIRHVAQQYQPANYHVLHKWSELGVDLRLYEEKRGFHMMVFDSERVLVSFSNEHNTDDRISFLTSNQTACDLFASYFVAIWQQAKEIHP